MPSFPRRVLITGASAGIGLGCAHVFAEAGASLVLWARRADRLDTIAAELRQRYGVDVVTQVVDVRDQPAVAAAIEAMPGGSDVDVLINNAGLSRGLEPIQDGVLQNWEEMIDTNVKGLLYVSRAILPLMIARKTGMVINIASIAGRQAYRGGNVYGSTKAAVRMLSSSMQIDLNGTGVRVCNIDPGLVETEFSVVRFRGDASRAATVYTGYQPLEGRDVAEAALFAATRPPHVSIQDIMITPTAQATVSIVDKTLPPTP